MNIELYNGPHNRIPFTNKEIISNVVKLIIDNISIVYNDDDIDSTKMYIKGGINKVESLMVVLNLKFKESVDVVEWAKDRFSKLNVPEDQPGLSLLSINEVNIPALLYPEMFNDFTTFTFWYKFTKPEYIIWNSKNTISTI